MKKADDRFNRPGAPSALTKERLFATLGDMMMRWSDDRLKSNFHRVRTPKVGEYQGPRYSLAYFNQANKSAIIQGKTKYPEAISAGQFLQDAMERNYKALQALKEAAKAN